MHPTTLTPFVQGLMIDQVLVYRNLALVPLKGNGNERIEYILAADAMDAGTLTITEVSEGGSVPELLAVSTAGTNILLLDGEELVGAKQNRILNTTILLLANGQTRIPVSCAEQGRWSRTSRAFKSGSTSSSTLRARKCRDVSRSLRTRGRAESDQGAVWDEVGSYMERTGTSSRTGAMHDAVEQQQGALDAYVAALGYPNGARGVVAAIGGRLIAVDLFDKPETLERVWPRLITGYALDAVAERPSGKRRYTTEQAIGVLERVGQVGCEPCPSVGVGDDWRFETDALVGQALVAEGTCVHLSVFPNGEADRDEAHRPPISPPSSRRPRGNCKGWRGWLRRVLGGDE